MCVFTRGGVPLFGVSIPSWTSTTERVELIFPFLFEKASWSPGQQFTCSQERLGPSTFRHHHAIQSQANSALYGVSSSLREMLKKTRNLG